MAGSISREALLKIIGDNADALAKLDEIDVKAKELEASSPTLTPQIEKEKALAEAKLLKAELKAEFDVDPVKAKIEPDVTDAAGVSLTELGAQLGELGNFAMPALIASLVALSPVLLTTVAGLGGLAVAAYSTFDPIIKAAQATGGLSANLSTLNPLQREAATGILNLGTQVKSFSAVLAPELFAVFDAGLQTASELLTDVQPVAKATGDALAQIMTQVAAGLQDAEWRQFFAWMAANAGPDIELVATTVGQLADALPPLLEDLQPVAREMLTLVGDAGQLTGALSRLISEESSLATKTSQSSGLLGAFGRAVVSAFEQLVPGAKAAGLLKDQLDKTGASASGAAGSASALASALGKNEAPATTLAQDITALNTALTALQTLTDNSINDNVDFANAQATLATALAASGGQLGLSTQAQRDASTATTAAGDAAIKLSENIYGQTGSAEQAVAPLEALIGQLQKTGDKSGYAQQEIGLLNSAIADIQSKTITLTIEGKITPSAAQAAAIVGGTGASMQQVANALGHASGGPASGLILVGEKGPEILAVPAGSYVYSNSQSKSMLSGGFGVGGGTGGGVVVQMVLSGEGPITTAIMESIRAQVHMTGGGGVNSVQRTFGQTA